jgi:triosephosphate isomerase
MFPDSEGNCVCSLYGGSVAPDNAAQIAELPEIGGLLIGGESLKATDLKAIIRAVLPIRAG